MANKLSDLLDQLAEKFPDEQLVTEAKDEYSKLYDEESAEGENDFDDGKDATDDASESDPSDPKAGKSFDDMMSADTAGSSDDPSADSPDVSAIFAKAKPKVDDKVKPKKPNPFAKF